MWGLLKWPLFVVFICLVIACWASYQSNKPHWEYEEYRKRKREEEEKARQARFVQVPTGAAPEQIRALYRDGNEPGTCWICGESNGEYIGSIGSRCPCHTCKRKYNEVLERGGPMPEGFTIYDFTMRLWGKLMIISARCNEGLIDEEEARRQTAQVIAEEKIQLAIEENERRRNLEKYQKHQQSLDNAEDTMRNLMS